MDRTTTQDPMRSTLDVGGAGFNEVGEGGVEQGRAMTTYEPQGQQHFIVAQHVPVKRSYASLRQRMAALASAAGHRYYYGWEVKDKRTGRKTWIEGPTIKLANDLAREFGNCSVDVRAQDHGTYWIFYARFVDLETGSNYARAFQQRKSQSMGMEDNARATDIVFQIGQSKAIRNVIVNVLQTFADEVLEAAKNSLLKRIGDNVEGAKKWILGELERLAIDRKRVETIYGRTAENWTVPNMAKIYAELQSIADGMMMADDVYPVDAKPEEGNPNAGGGGEPPKEEARKTEGGRRKATDKNADKGAAGGKAESVAHNIVDTEGKKLGVFAGAPMKIGDPWTGPDGLYHVEAVGQDDGGFIVATVKKHAAVAGGTSVPAGFGGTAKPPAEQPQAAAPAATKPAAASRAKTRFFSDDS